MQTVYDSKIKKVYYLFFKMLIVFTYLNFMQNYSAKFLLFDDKQTYYIASEL